MREQGLLWRIGAFEGFFSQHVGKLEGAHAAVEPWLFSQIHHGEAF